ncbi:hypothetical protein [Nonomuraea sp. B5E05]|uniref:hypothetical protein n=1 Tax=Nonomuraea sp. B5E05 TaxID=3153569 RepID=UPI0032603234
MHDEDQVRIADRGQAVGDDEACPPPEEGLQGVVHPHLRDRVQVGCRLVEDDDAGICEQPPGERDGLAILERLGAPEADHILTLLATAE